MTTEHPIVERLADHSDMLATLTDIVARLTQRVERLEQADADNLCAGLTAAGPDLHDRFCPSCCP